ncbi:MAG: hypothetical protein IJ382_02005 [Flavobacteriales bacterium]|nr:hypothetical protein [Flavobacteriales bacterium]
MLKKTMISIALLAGVVVAIHMYISNLFGVGNDLLLQNVETIASGEASSATGPAFDTFCYYREPDSDFKCIEVVRLCLAHYPDEECETKICEDHQKIIK